MSTQYTPYETQPVPDPEPRRSNATKPLMILLAVIGGVTLVVVLATTVFSSAIGLSSGSATQSANATGATELEVDADAARFDLEFAAVNEATLEATGVGADRWELTRNGDTLQVQAPNRWWNWCIFGCNDRESQVTLTLPQTLNDGSLNADLDLNAGRLFADGDFNELSLELNAGEATLDGTARTLDAQVNAGSANLTTADVETANLEVAAGRLTTTLTGTPPTSTTIEVSAGRLDLTVPDGPYAVTSDVAAGNLDNQLTTTTEAPHRIAVEVAAGEVTLRPATN